MLTSLCACMKVGMTRSRVESKLKDVDAKVNYLGTTPMTKEGELSYPFEDRLLARKTYTLSVDGVDTEVEQQLYIIYCGSDECADWTLEACKSWLEQNKSDEDKWYVYSYDKVVMCGYYALLAVARGY